MNKTEANTEEAVTQFLAELNHAESAAIEELRRIIKATAPELQEHIKWNAPSYLHNGRDRITFQLHGRPGIRLIFHCGAKAKPQQLKERMGGNYGGMLQWAGNDRAIASFSGMEDVASRRDILKNVITDWLGIGVE